MNSMKIINPVIKKRKERDGDWICFVCCNYNYAFRALCIKFENLGNRCHMQTKEENSKILE